MLINSPNISGSLNVSGNTVITGSLTTSIAALNSAASIFLTSDGGTIKSRTAAQTLSDIGAQASGSYLTISSATGSYVPYTGATGTVNLGYNPLVASRIRIDGNAPTAGSHLGFKQATNVDTGDGGYTSISTFGTNTMTFVFAQPTGFKRFSFNVFGITQDVSGGRVYSMPDESGTLALTSNLGSYLPLTGGGAITGSLIVTGGITGNVTGSATTASYVEYSNVANKPTLVSGSSQVTFLGLSSIPSGIVSGSAQVAQFGYATTGSNGFNGSQSITGSLTVTGQVIAQTLNVQQVTSSVVYSSGSNIFGNSLANTQQFTGSVYVTGSLALNGVMSLNNDGTYGSAYKTLGFTGNTNGSHRIFAGTSDDMFFAAATGRGLDFRVSGSANSSLYIAATGTATFSSTVTATGAVRSINGGVDGTFADAFVGVYNSNNNEQNAIQTAVSSGASQSGFRFRASNGGGSTDRTTVVDFLRDRQIFYGNVGIGTTSPGYKLDITNSVAASTSLEPITLRLYNGSDGGSAIYFLNAVGGQSKISFGVESTGAGTDDTYLGFSTGANTTLTERMRITSGGTVQIVGSAGTLQVGTNSGDHTTLNYSGGGTTLNTNWASTSALLRLRANGVGMTVTGAGRVGIGVENPDAGLQIAQVGQDDQLTIGSIVNNRDHAAFMCSGANKAEILRYQSATRLIIGSSANISTLDVIPGGTNGVRLSAGNTSWSAYTSDERKKKNFETVPGLEAITQINPVKYHFKTQEDSEAKKLGFTAQNIQPLIPEMVHPNGEKAEDGSDILTIIPDYILPVLVKAIQELKAENDTLKSRIDTLEQA